MIYLSKLMDKILPFKFKVDYFKCITIDSSSIPRGEVEFGTLMESSIQEWTEIGYVAIWLLIPVDLSHLIPISIDLGFEYHHAKKDYLCLSKWLKNSPSKLPEYASVSIGVGGFVYDKTTKTVLVVKEKTGPNTTSWKLPGGLVDRGEEIYEGAIREVFEETGVRAKFDSLIYFKASHHNQFDVSNMYFVALMTPETKDINIQEDEIEEARWMSFKDLEVEKVSPVFSKIIEIAKSSIDHGNVGITFEKQKAYNTEFLIYHNKL